LSTADEEIVDSDDDVDTKPEERDAAPHANEANVEVAHRDANPADARENTDRNI
jgi:hypothetical protein